MTIAEHARRRDGRSRYSRVIVKTDRAMPVVSITSHVRRAAFETLDATARHYDLRRGHLAGRLLAAVLRRPELVAELLAEEESR